MKMTMHIDEKLLDEVMDTFGCVTKTDAVDFALRELIRKRKLREFGKTGLGLTPDELANAFYPDYDPLSLRCAETPPKPRDGKPRSDR
jgi:hypothetical protein